MSSYSAFRVPAGPVGNSVLLYDYTVAGADKASIDTGVDTPNAGIAGTSAFPLTYGVLEVWILAQTDQVTAAGDFTMILNNDTSGIYDLQNDYGNNTATGAGVTVGDTKWALVAHGTGGSSANAAVISMCCPGYAGTTFNKVFDATLARPDGTAANMYSLNWALGYRSTSAVARIKIAGVGAGKFKIGTRLLIYAR